MKLQRYTNLLDSFKIWRFFFGCLWCCSLTTKKKINCLHLICCVVFG